MKPFNWEIGEVPEGWQKANIVRVQNGDFTRGPTAAVTPVFYDYSIEIDSSICFYTFQRVDAPRVRAWVDWFMKEYDE